MKTINTSTSACRLCKYFQPEGRRGGFCQQLGASVRGCWEACPLAIPPFAPSWENVGDNLYRTTVKIEPEVTQETKAPIKARSSVWNHADKCQLSVTKMKFNSLKA
ncbi:hypothetical protein [Merismopedia glauca]|uniref:Uncharacterized protein n=1 Tax=Merismopedia glauca CCAP 1448/3 TaxID=1296344 RepID=A0A2T1BWX1_9CYAN|nr:hypothetical protein [Merismopedia glauca]PSB00423.1 hypothetical protein C7B64_23585 [Merismopedia glauca CCAP 1448/3]